MGIPAACCEGSARLCPGRIVCLGLPIPRNAACEKRGPVRWDLLGALFLKNDDLIRQDLYNSVIFSVRAHVILFLFL